MTEASERSPGEELAAAVERWFATMSDFPVVATSWFVIAAGPGYEDSGEDVHVVNTNWSGNILEHLALLRYATKRAEERIFSTQEDE